MDIMLDSLHAYIADFSADKLIMLIMAVFAVVGGIDKIRGNKWGYGARYDEGFEALGALAIAMVGMIALVPVIKLAVEGAVSRLFLLMGADPSLFAGIFMDIDVGGYLLAKELASTEAMGCFTGMIIAAVMGVNPAFNIPVALAIIREEDRKYLASGTLLGFTTVPIACFVGGFVMIAFGWDLTIKDVLLNTMPILVLSVLIIAGLLRAPDKMLKGFLAFGKGVTILITAGTVIAVFQYLTGLRLPLFHVMVEPDAAGVVPLEDAVAVTGAIALVLIGAFPMVTFITRKFSAPLTRLGKQFDLDETSMVGLISNLPNNILVFQLMKDMNPKGKILNCAFTVSASFVLGDHLAFVASVNQEMMIPNIAAKLVGGFTALIAANLLWERFLPDQERKN